MLYFRIASRHVYLKKNVSERKVQGFTWRDFNSGLLSVFFFDMMATPGKSVVQIDYSRTSSKMWRPTDGESLSYSSGMHARGG